MTTREQDNRREGDGHEGVADIKGEPAAGRDRRVLKSTGKNPPPGNLWPFRY